MTPDQMLRLFESHRDAEARRDFDAILETFVEDCYLETIALGTRAQGRPATRAAYVGYFAAFPDLRPDDDGFAFGDDVLVSWGYLNGSSGGEWLGLPPTGRPFRVPFTNVTTFGDERMVGESLYFDLASLCEQAGLSVGEVRAAAKARAAASPT